MPDSKKQPACFLASLILVVISPSSSAVSLVDWTASIKSLCMSPDQPGKFWQIDSQASAGGDVQVKLIGKAEAGAGVTFSKGEWDGIKKVLQEEQASENKNYRDCIQAIVPLLKDKLSENTKGLEPNKPVATLDLSVPLGTQRENVTQQGTWDSINGNIYFQSQQNLMGVNFDVSTLFVGDQAEKAFLKLRKEYVFNSSTTNNDPNGSSKETGSQVTVSSYCYGDRYKSFISKIIGRLGEPIASSESEKVEKSGELEWSGGLCSYSKAGCEKHWTQEYKTERFSDNGLALEYKATRNDISRFQALGNRSQNLSREICDWILIVSRG